MEEIAKKRGRPRGSTNAAKRARTENTEPRRSARLQQSESSGNVSLLVTDSHSEHYEPPTYADAISCDQGAEWKLSADDEINALLSNNTWEPVVLPEGRKALKTKWVFKIKKDEHGREVKKKSRLTIKGYVQKQGVDYWETYSPVAKLISVRIFFAIATLLKMKLFQVDVNNAFLNADLKEDIYMEVPEGYDIDSVINSLPADHELRGADRSRIVLKLKKALYGLKQAPREWYLKVSAYLRTLGYEALKADSCIFVRRVGDHFSMIALYVDDMLIASTDTNSVKADVRALNKEYKMKNIGTPKQLLGLNVEIDKVAGTTKLSQQKYIGELLERFRMTEAKTKPTPADKDIKLSKEMCPKTAAEAREMAKFPYRELVGCLLYLSVGTRPDISFAVSELSKFLVNPGKQHWTAALHVLRYLKGTKEKGITYRRGSGNSAVELKAYSDFQFNGPSKRSQVKLEAYSDADWGGDKDTRRSHTGAVLFLAGGPVAWISKKQSSVAMSSAEAEYMAASLTCREVLWVRYILAGLGFKQQQATPIFEDNSACIQMSKNPVQHNKTKHIDLHHHFVRERVEGGDVKLVWVPTGEMIADLLTKALPTATFEKLRDMMFDQVSVNSVSV